MLNKILISKLLLNLILYLKLGKENDQTVCHVLKQLQISRSQKANIKKYEVMSMVLGVRRGPKAPFGISQVLKEPRYNKLYI